MVEDTAGRLDTVFRALGDPIDPALCGAGVLVVDPQPVLASDGDDERLAQPFEVTPELTLDIGYRYLDMGDAESGDLIAYDGTNDVDNPMEFKDITSHDIRVGLRYLLH